MADASAFLQGSTTGGILQNLNTVPNSPSATQSTGLQAAVQSAIQGGMDAQTANWWAQKAASLASGHDFFLPDSMPPAFQNFIQNASSGGAGSVTNLPSSGTTAAGAAVGGATDVANNNNGQSGSTPGGQMSPAELAAAQNALADPKLPAGFGTGGGGGGGGASGGGASGGGSSGTTGGTGAGTGSGLGLGALAGGGALPGGTPSFSNPTIPVTPTTTFQSPGGNSTPGAQGVLQMNPANAQNGLAQYQNTTGYQLLNDPNAYQQSPGYQYAMDQAMQQVQNGASARGMLESGAVLKNMQQTASGLAQQDYGNWWNRQNQLYGDYQNRLQGLAGGATGSQDAMTSAANLGQSYLQTGSNLGSLFGNQGTTGMGGIINTGAAQSGNIINAGQQQAQVNAANQSTQLAGATLGTKAGLF